MQVIPWVRNGTPVATPAGASAAFWLTWVGLSAGCSGGQDVTTMESQGSSPAFVAEDAVLTSGDGLAPWPPLSSAWPAVDAPPPRASLSSACSFGTAEPDLDLLARKPYLQNVTATSAVVVFTTRDLVATELPLELSQPPETWVQTLLSEADPADTSGHQQRVRLSGLEPDTVYCYRLEGDRALGFRTPPLPGSNAVVRFAALGDSGGASRDGVLARLEQAPIDLLLHTGDIAYQTGTLAEFELKFFSTYAALIASVPFFPASGNHDYSADGAETFRQVFALPENGAPHGLERWYSFDWGDVHFVALDTERVGDEQALWLEQDLARNTLPWKVVYMHRPPYSSGSHGSALGVREAFGPHFEAHGVQLVLAGHDHDYERTEPIGGVTYVVTGGGGYGLRPVGQSDFTAFSLSAFHYVWVEVDGDELSLRAIDDSGEAFDGVTLARDVPPSAFAP